LGPVLTAFKDGTAHKLSRGDIEKYGRVVEYSGLGQRTVGFSHPDAIRELLHLVTLELKAFS
jgi:hypothetical protein